MRINFIIAVIFLGAMLVLGGASRSEVHSLPFVWLAAVFMIAIALMQIDRQQWREIRLPVLFLLAVAAIIGVQLVPLPPGTWAAMPGHASYVDALRNAGVDDVWRPWSLTPDLTLNALLAVLPPLAAVFAFGTTDRALRVPLVSVLLIGIVGSVMIGLLQIASGSGYFYAITNEGAAVGFFSNRNHFAVLLSAGFPALACWTAMPHPDPNFRRVRRWLALCAAAAIFPLLLTTGSRAGLTLGVVAALLALGIRVPRPSEERGSTDRAFSRQLLACLPLAVGLAAVLAAILLSRDVAIRRLLAGDDDLRSVYLPLYFDMAKAYFPFGAGFGSFDSVFRAFEPIQTLSAFYMNQAHNDLIQIVIEGGLLAALAAIVFSLWFAARAWSLWRHKIRSPADLLGRTGSVIVLLLLLSSAVDYPLRTPALAVLMAVSCCWMLPRRGAGSRGTGLGSESGLS
jgi:O-antigen ligase